MQLTEIQQLQNLLDVAFSYDKSECIKLQSEGVSVRELCKITGFKSTNQIDRILHGKIGQPKADAIVRACRGLYEYNENKAKDNL